MNVVNSFVISSLSIRPSYIHYGRLLYPYAAPNSAPRRAPLDTFSPQELAFIISATSGSS